ncbi:peptidoglycan/xylan/chitin deacetylase (PgdA/CDA1 family) [Lewinella marina]|uniref:polysaccharide deacetylase family protein n=1 Tax=Neolewinella marina TaxID=438751 RepID=UPI00142F4CD3|nr:polysaccharide deacetylase family protein [Neolewinella marina]NJB86674.1 peptidoglycan/xylan/chitin deacetylase (PgdA/CDA1 family) [Neolewinella marina]
MDFELHWGVFDHMKLDATGRMYFKSTRELVPITLKLFANHGVAATWATVGMLFARSREELSASAPEVRPSYINGKLNPYALLGSVGRNEREDPYHFAPTLIQNIIDTPYQEIGSHTFSHFYCLERGASAEAFAQDLQAAQHLAKANFGVNLTSLVYPRNQSNFMPIVEKAGFTSYRGNPPAWFWRAANGEDTSMPKKMARLLDHYIPLSSHTGSTLYTDESRLKNVPASRFFRPFVPKLDAYGGQKLKLRRIRSEMTAAAEAGKTYHLWWHPHNLATNPQRNMAGLNEILTHFSQLRKDFGMQSVTMQDLSKTV